MNDDIRTEKDIVVLPVQGTLFNNVSSYACEIGNILDYSISQTLLIMAWHSLSNRASRDFEFAARNSAFIWRASLPLKIGSISCFKTVATDASRFPCHRVK